MRLINADELMDFLQMLPIDLGYREVEDIRAHIREMPKIESERQWIPCSERLPDKDGRYLVTCSKIGAWEVDWNIWHCEPKPSWLWEQGVIAWMPLPDPYEPEEQDANK